VQKYFSWRRHKNTIRQLYRQFVNTVALKTEGFPKTNSVSLFSSFLHAICVVGGRGGGGRGGVISKVRQKDKLRI